MIIWKHLNKQQAIEYLKTMGLIEVAEKTTDVLKSLTVQTIKGRLRIESTYYGEQLAFSIPQIPTVKKWSVYIRLKDLHQTKMFDSETEAVRYADNARLDYSSINDSDKEISVKEVEVEESGNVSFE